MSNLIRYNHYGLSDTGSVRPNNEDAWAANAESGLYLVADGMGGHAAGEVAAHLAATWIPRIVLEKCGEPDFLVKPSAQVSVINILKTASHEILVASLKNPEHAGMGTTVVLGLIRGDRAMIANVGDSRAYLFRKNELFRLTRDHSAFQELLDKGLVSENEQRGHPGRFQLTQCLGHDSEIHPAVVNLQIKSGDQVLLCSDGLHDMLNDSLIQDVLMRHEDLRSSCEELVAAAKHAGGLDNITVLMIKAP